MQVKTEPLDNDCNPSEFQERSSLWVKVKDITLTNYDEEMLVNGEKLSDKDINLAQRILKSKFPKINGLRLTLLQDKSHKEPTNSALQILHTGGDHWICANTIGTASGKKVLVCDSAYTRWDDTSICLLKVQFRCSASISNSSIIFLYAPSNDTCAILSFYLRIIMYIIF